jgi:RND family efflux transporter MFP subunit
MMRKQVAAFGLLLAGLLAGCKGKPVEQPARPVKTKAIERLVTSAGTRYSASITPSTQIELAFKVGGYVDGVQQVRGVDGQMRYVQGGDFVNRGTILARVRQSDYQVKVNEAQSQAAEAQSGLEMTKAQRAQALQAVETAKAQLAEADAASNRAKLDFERASILFASRSITRTDYDSAKAQHDVAEARLAAARSQVRTAEAATRVASAQINTMEAKTRGSRELVNEASIPLGDTALRAPMSSMILKREVEVGSLVSPGRPGFLLADVSSVKAAFGVPDRVVANLKIGMPLSITTEAAPGDEFHGQITSISPTADPRSRVFDVEVTIPNSANTLKVGMVVSIEAQGGQTQTEILVVPVSAIVPSKTQPGGYAVFVVETQGGKQLARMRDVKLGEAYGNTVAITEGVTPGEQVITTGASLVIDGEQVVLIP